MKQEKLVLSKNNLYQNIKRIIMENDHNYKILVNTLKLVNPLGILEKGYSLVTVDDKLIKSSQDLKVNDVIHVRLHDGSVDAQVSKIID